MICPACQAEHQGPAISAGATDGTNWRYRTCPVCGHWVQDPLPDDAQLSAYYGPDYYGSGETKFPAWLERWIDRHREAKADRIASLTGRPGRLLDIGCGSGAFAARMQHRGFTVSGIEYPGEAADRAARIPGLEITVTDINHLSLPERGQDVITLWHVLEHLRDPRTILTACRHALVPGGWLVLDVPNGDSWQARGFGDRWFHLDPPRHLHQFTFASMTHLLRNAGFTDTTIAATHQDMGLYGWLQSGLNTLLPHRDDLYTLIKTRGRAGYGPGRTLANAVGGTALLPLAIAGYVAEALADRQAVLRCVARAPA